MPKAAAVAVIRPEAAMAGQREQTAAAAAVVAAEAAQLTVMVAKQLQSNQSWRSSKPKLSSNR